MNEIANEPPYHEFDPEVVDLCRAINALPGLQTIESCCGHGKGPFRIWFRVEEGDHRGLFVLARAANRRYWYHGHQWGIRLDVSDIAGRSGELPVNYVLESTLTDEDVYAQALSLVESIEDHAQDRVFLKLFGITSLSDPPTRRP